MIDLLLECFVRFINFISPKACAICGCRLAIGEDVICSACNIHLPRTHFSAHPRDNKMARNFWGRMNIERAVALFYYEPHSEVNRIVHSFKYFNHPENAEFMGRMMADELIDGGFFSGIDIIVPVPLAKKRQRSRGYNQSMEMARGVSGMTGIPIRTDIVCRRTFKKSQTTMNRWQRNDNVKDAFELKNGNDLDGKHILIIDDVVTSGSTVIACANAISRRSAVRFSVLSLGFTR